jgi:hypothetical protein
MKPDLKAIMGGKAADAHEEPDGDEMAPMGEGEDAADPMADAKQSDDPTVQAAGLVREAITAGDDDALADALKSFMTIHNTAPAGDMTPKPKLIGSKT